MGVIEGLGFDGRTGETFEEVCDITGYGGGSGRLCCFEEEKERGDGKRKMRLRRRRWEIKGLKVE